MSKMLATCAAAALAAVLALPAPAGAAERNAAGVKQTTDLTDVSSARRYRRGYVRHYYGPRRYYGRPYYAPYRAYGYDPYYRPYRPGVSIGVGPFGFGLY